MPMPNKKARLKISIAEMIERYQRGEGLMDISLAAGISTEGVRDYLVCNGVTIRPRGGIPGKTSPKYYRI